MKYIDIEYIKNFLDEVEALYDADDGAHYPQYIEDMILNIRNIIQEEQAEDR